VVDRVVPLVLAVDHERDDVDLDLRNFHWRILSFF
jgi:hypothetical protein